LFAPHILRWWLRCGKVGEDPVYREDDFLVTDLFFDELNRPFWWVEG